MADGAFQRAQRARADSDHVTVRPGGAGPGLTRPSVVSSGRQVQDVLGAPGEPLSSPAREEMEARLGADFSQVRVHTDSAARASAAGIGAGAYTWGNHVVIGAGWADRLTLAHELVHVIQQREGPVSGTDDGSGLGVSDPSDRFERAAAAVAERAVRGTVPRPRYLVAPGHAGPRSGLAAGTPLIRAIRPGPGPNSLVVQRVQITRGVGPKKIVVWDTEWDNDEKERRLAQLTDEQTESLSNNPQFQKNEGEAFKKRVEDRAAGLKADKNPKDPGKSTTGGSAPHRKTPGGKTRALRLTYAPMFKSATDLAHIKFFVHHAVELGLTLLITTTERGKESIKALGDVDWAKLVIWDIVPDKDEENLSKWAEDNVEYLESGMRVETRHFAGDPLEAAMKRGRSQRGVWGSRGANADVMSVREGVPLGTKVNTPGLKGAKEGQVLRQRIRAYIEGGNMITGEDAEQRLVILVGRDAIDATATLYERPPDAIRAILAEDFGVTDDRVVPVEQPGTFHLDMGMLFVGDGVVIVNDSRADLSEQREASVILGTIIALEDEAAKDLERAGLKVIRKSFSSDSHNFFNGEFVLGNDGGIYYLTNGGGRQQEGEFREFLQGYGVKNVFFTPAAVAASTLAEKGGVGCRAKGIPDRALMEMLHKVEMSKKEEKELE